MKNRIIINIFDDTTESEAISMVKQVIEEGKISTDSKGNKYYCFASTFKAYDTMANKQNYNFVVVTKLYTKHPTFNVYKIKD